MVVDNGGRSSLYNHHHHRQHQQQRRRPEHRKQHSVDCGWCRWCDDCGFSGDEQCLHGTAWIKLQARWAEMSERRRRRKIGNYMNTAVLARHDYTGTLHSSIPPAHSPHLKMSTSNTDWSASMLISAVASLKQHGQLYGGSVLYLPAWQASTWTRPTTCNYHDG